MFPRMFGRSTRGIYYNSSGIQTILAAAHTSLQGFWWLINPVGSGIKAAVRRVEFKYSAISAAAANTRLQVQRITFTGGPASATLTPIRRTSIEPAALCLPLTATTGIVPATVSANAPIYTSWAPVVVTAAGILTPPEDYWLPTNEDGMAILLPGEGIVVQQVDAGVASDPRVVIVSAEWEEYS